MTLILRRNPAASNGWLPPHPHLSPPIHRTTRHPHAWAGHANNGAANGAASGSSSGSPVGAKRVREGDEEEAVHKQPKPNYALQQPTAADMAAPAALAVAAPQPMDVTWPGDPGPGSEGTPLPRVRTNFIRLHVGNATVQQYDVRIESNAKITKKESKRALLQRAGETLFQMMGGNRAPGWAYDGDKILYSSCKLRTDSEGRADTVTIDVDQNSKNPARVRRPRSSPRHARLPQKPRPPAPLSRCR